MKSINDLGRLSDDVRKEIHQSLSECIDSGWYILGKNVTSFEEEFASYNGTSYCISVANGTDALEIGLRALGVKSGDKVITVANAGFYSSIGILACGAEPAYADIDPATYTMSPESLKKVLTNEVKAVILTHLYGTLGDVESILEICEKHGIPLLEDCAQAHGASLGGRKAGSFGRLSCFSFYPTKNLGAMGDGGALCTSDSELAERIRLLRQYGWGKKYSVDIPHGGNSRLDEMQACILRIKLRKLDRWNEERRAVAARYGKGIANPSIARKPSVSGEGYVAHLYVLETDDRAGLSAWLKGKGIPSDVHYPIPDHRQKVFGNMYAAVTLENTERACGRVLTLPCFPEMTVEETEQVIAAVNGWGTR
jgi:dTDP-3-amino-2,3,6-trideoxy-4-keto-D-glucose/dTDP-3-amino-3,4,6-trideoxy-alpha-D-glucose/dTDP-2,6-dideoxy-D-kanosamine transaminase